MCDHTVLIESDDYGVIEDGHATFMHAITDYFKNAFAATNNTNGLNQHTQKFEQQTSAAYRKN